MLDKITKENFFITIIPGGLLALYLFYFLDLDVSSLKAKAFLSNELLATFAFLAVSVVFGEIIQMVAKWFDFIIKACFKCSLPSEIFLFKNNPVINAYTREDFLKQLAKDGKSCASKFDIDYQKISCCSIEVCSLKQISQNIFSKIYKNIISERVQASNIRYLYMRSYYTLFLILGIFALLQSIMIHEQYWYLFALDLVLAVLFSCRASGYAKGLVQDVVFNYISKEPK